MLSVLLFVALTLAVKLFLDRQGSGGGPNVSGDPAYVESPAAAARANGEGRLVTAQDQAVHRARLPRSVATRGALERAIVLDMRARVARGDLSGPVQRVTCKALRSGRAGRPRFRCQASAGGFSYPFDGVADLRAAVLTWCKDDSAAYDPAVEAPLSGACTS